MIFINSFIFTDPDAKNYLDAIRAVDQVKNELAVQNLFKNLKAGGNYIPGYPIYPMYGNHLDAVKINATDPRNLDAAFRLTFPAGITVSADGIQGNGTSQYVKTFFTGANFTLNNTCLAFYSGTNQSRSETEITVFSGANSHQLSLRIADIAYFESYKGNDSLSRLTFASTNSLGLHLENRTASNNHNAWIRGTKVATAATVSGALHTLEYRLLCLNDNGTNSTFSSKKCMFAALLPGRSDAQAIALNNTIKQFNTELGRSVTV